VLASLAFGVTAYAVAEVAPRRLAMPPRDVTAVEWAPTRRAPGDSVQLAVRWNPSCDGLGCADSYRVTWTWAAERPRASDGDRGNGVAILPEQLVVREVVTDSARDVLRHPAPAYGTVATACVSIVALRRGLASSARSACRTVERIDVAPPPVDSIRWDSLGVETDTTLVYGRVVDTTFGVEWGGYQYNIAWSEDSSHAELRDSAALEVVTLDGGERAARMYKGWATTLCPTVADRDGSYWVIVPRANDRWTPTMVTHFKNRCGNTARIAASGKPPRWFYDAVHFDVADYDKDAPEPADLRQAQPLATMIGVPRTTPAPPASRSAPRLTGDPLLTLAGGTSAR